MPHEKYLIIQLHELLQYLVKRGILTMVVVAQHGMLGEAMVPDFMGEQESLNTKELSH